MNAGGEAAMNVVMDIIARQSRGEIPEPMTDRETNFDMWHEMTRIVDTYNDPGTFTAFHAYEWMCRAVTK